MTLEKQMNFFSVEHGMLYSLKSLNLCKSAQWRNTGSCTWLSAQAEPVSDSVRPFPGHVQIPSILLICTKNEGVPLAGKKRQVIWIGKPYTIMTTISLSINNYYSEMYIIHFSTIFRDPSFMLCYRILNSNKFACSQILRECQPRINLFP